MRSVRILCVGKIRERYLAEGLAKLSERIGRYCDFRTVVVKEAKYASGSPAEWMRFEERGILKHLDARHFTVVCDERGVSMTSDALANSFGQWANRGFSRLDFVVGGAYGLSETVRERANLLLSFSPMTMPHRMFRLFLYEQIYRAFTILKGEKYHHL